MKRRLEIPMSSSLEGSEINPWNARPFSNRYYEILKQRKNLPVYLFRDELVQKVRNHQVIVVEGETGSGTY